MKTKDLTLTAVLIALLVVCSQLSIPIGPVPITLQTLAVLMIGYLLTPKYTLLTISIYIMAGLMGLPFFSGFTGGLHSVLLPSFGFVLSFMVAAYIQALYIESKQLIETKHLLIAGVINIVITYVIGLTYMAFILNFYMGNQMGLFAILMAGFIPFIPGDLFKLFLAVLMAKRIIPIYSKKND